MTIERNVQFLFYVFKWARICPHENCGRLFTLYNKIKKKKNAYQNTDTSWVCVNNNAMHRVIEISHYLIGDNEKTGIDSANQIAADAIR